MSNNEGTKIVKPHGFSYVLGLSFDHLKCHLRRKAPHPKMISEFILDFKGPYWEKLSLKHLIGKIIVEIIEPKSNKNQVVQAIPLNIISTQFMFKYRCSTNMALYWA